MALCIACTFFKFTANDGESQTYAVDCVRQGTILSEIGLLTELTRMDLNLTGRFLLEGLPKLLTGSIPNELGLLTKLTYMDLRYNSNLTGPMPTALGTLTKLTFLALI